MYTNTNKLFTLYGPQAARVFFGDGLFDLAAEKDEEATAFAMTVARIRNAYKFDDEETNPGCIRSPVFINSCHANLDTSVKVYSFSLLPSNQ